MRLALLLVVRTGTAIAVATAAVQFWNLAVHGETPQLGPSIALPPTPTAVAAVVPRSHRQKVQRPRAEPGATAVASAETGTSLGSVPMPVSKPDGTAPATPSKPHDKPDAGAPAPKPSPSADQPADPPRPEPPAEPEIVPQPPQPPPPEDDAESAHHPPPPRWPPWLRPQHRQAHDDATVDEH